VYVINQPVASLRRVPFELFDATGTPITGGTVSFSNPPAAGEVQISKAGGLYTDVTGSVVEIGSGTWYYQGVIGDFDTLGLLILRVNKTTAKVFKFQDEVVPAASSGGGGATPLTVPSKMQFVSTESLKLVFQPFVNSATGAQFIGTDAVTLVIKRPNGTLLPSPPTPTFDTDVNLWTANIPSASFMAGEWLVLASSNGANSRGQNQVLTWGDYVEDIHETRQAALGRWKIDASTKKLFLYEDDGVTVFKTFDLKDSTGLASVTQIFERTPE